MVEQPIVPNEDPRDAALRIEIGERLKKFRRLLDPNRTRFAEGFQMNGQPVFHATWRKWERGEVYPNIQVMIDLCDRYKVTLDFLYRGDAESLPERLRYIMYHAYPELLEQQMARKVGQNPGPGAVRPDPEDPLLPPKPERQRRRRGTRDTRGMEALADP